MRVHKAFCITIIGMLLLSVNVLAVVYDDEGKVIWPDEIEREMDEMHRIVKHTGKGCIGVGCLSSGIGVILVGAAGLGDISEGPGRTGTVLGATLVVAGVPVAVLGYVVYKVIDAKDRKEAIERIKERRRTQKQESPNTHEESFAPESRVILQLLSGSF